ncbi:MAG: 50S ribosomal protein L25 [Candidatus Saccharimonadia bacterium]
MDTIHLSATKRTEKGKKVLALRKSGFVPAVMYGHGQASEPITLDAKELEKIYAIAGSNKIVDLKITGDKDINVLFHDVQHDSRTGLIIHADLYLVRMDEKIRTEVPLRFTGESTAVYQLEGTLFKNLEMLEIEALPADLPEAIEVDISILDDFEKTIHVSDLVIPPKVELLTDIEELVAKVEEPRSEEELAELDAEVGEAVPEGVADEEAESTEEGNESSKDK